MRIRPVISANISISTARAASLFWHQLSSKSLRTFALACRTAIQILFARPAGPDNCSALVLGLAVATVLGQSQASAIRPGEIGPNEKCYFVCACVGPRHCQVPRMIARPQVLVCCSSEANRVSHAK